MQAMASRLDKVVKRIAIWACVLAFSAGTVLTMSGCAFAAGAAAGAGAGYIAGHEEGEDPD